MNKLFSTVIVAALFLSFLAVFAPSTHAGELDSFIHDLNIQAEADLGGFKARLSAHFGVPAPEINVLIGKVDTPADAYMCLRVGQVANQPTETVLREYKANKGKGWGVIAKNLGIKPGSEEFHALKRGQDLYSNNEGKAKGKKKH